MLGLGVVAVVLYVFFGPDFDPIMPPEDPLTAEIFDAYQVGGNHSGLEILYPLDGTLFPADIVAPTFRWEDDQGSDIWVVAFAMPDGKGRLRFLTSEKEFTPSQRQWELIKARSRETEATVTVIGAKETAPKESLSAASVTFDTSKDEVGAPIFYREVNLPFIDAVRDPSKIRWCFGAVSSPEHPPVVLENLPVCGNCHSFSQDGKTLAMDVDYANNKGSYVITRVARKMSLATSEIITWNDYKKEDREQTFGLLSQISPDGRFVVSTVKDKSVFVAKPGLEFSQLFFPIKGILVVYDRGEGTFEALPGADDPRFVQSNPTWSPDGKHIVFARTEAYSLKDTSGGGQTILSDDECKEFLQDGKTFHFDLYRLPFNGGSGGTPEPIEGASNNGMSNYFAKYSPDGKWIVFCKARNYMLLQPDSELYIIPAEGGEARRLRCNTPRMNSWHSFSPNGRWLVFSSKANSPYTQLFLTHIDEQGYSTPPVLLSHFTASSRAANIPEFVDTKPSAIERIDEQFLDDYSYVRAADECYQQKDADGAIRHYRKAVQINPHNVKAHQRLGFLLFHQKKMREAIPHLSEALRISPEIRTETYDRADVEGTLGSALYLTGKFPEATVHLSEALRRDPENPDFHYRLALVSAAGGEIDRPLEHCAKAVELMPNIDVSAPLHFFLGKNYAKAGRNTEAILSMEKALKLAQAAGAKDLAREIQRQLRLLTQKMCR